MIKEPPGPGEPGHDLVTWSAYKQKKYQASRARWVNKCRREGVLPHSTGPYWPEVDIDADNPAALSVDELEQHDG